MISAWRRRAMLLTLAAAGALGPSGARSAQEAPVLRAGAARVKITPSLDRKVYIAGYDSNRVAEGVHDDLWARALVLDDGATRLAVVVCDLVGLSNHRVRKIRERIRSVPREQVLVCTTHNHSGPDTLGLWGESRFVTGMDAEYMERLERLVSAAVEEAAGQLRPVSMRAGAVAVPDGLVHNSREPVQDRELTTLRFVAADGVTVGTLIHYGAHPEVNKSKSLTSDFVHYVREGVERRHGGTAIYLNGALGGMVTPRVSGTNNGHTFEEMKRVGEGVARAALEALSREAPADPVRLGVKQRDVWLPLENEGFRMLAGAKVLDVGELADGRLRTEVWRVDLGPVTWIAIPGEVLPRPALELKEGMPGRHRLVVSMANDELGYILHPDDFDRPLFRYEKSMSVGKRTWPLLSEAARELLR